MYLGKFLVLPGRQVLGIDVVETKELYIPMEATKWGLQHADTGNYMSCQKSK